VGLTGAARPLRAAIVGCGRIASTIQDELEGRPGIQIFPYSHAGAYRAAARTELVAAVDSSPERLQAFGARWGVDRLYRTVDELLAAEEVDLVSICAPTRAHASVFETVVPAVRGVLLEKPIAITLAEADRMIEVARAHGTHVAVDHTRTFDSWYRRAKELIDEGTIGEVQAIFALWAEGWSGGGSHLFDLVRFLVGGRPDWVFCHPDGSGARDPGGSALVHYESGLRLFVEAPRGGLAPLEVDLVGTGGRLRLGTYRMQLYVNDTSRGYAVPAEWPFFGRMEMTSGLTGAVEQLAAAVDGGPAPSSTLEHARDALELAVALNRSAATGAVCRLPISDRDAGVEAD
jgi:predicted dehydrogenase